MPTNTSQGLGRKKDVGTYWPLDTKKKKAHTKGFLSEAQKKENKLSFEKTFAACGL